MKHLFDDIKKFKKNLQDAIEELEYKGPLDEYFEGYADGLDDALTRIDNLIKEFKEVC